jgi:cold-inducible RNA-binding protein
MIYRRGAMPVRLFVGNLPYDVTEAELKEYFSAAGPLSYVYLPTDRESGKPRGFAFVEFQDRAQAEEAIRRFNNQPFKSRPLAVNEARSRDSGSDTRRTPSAQPYPSRMERGSLPAAAEPPAREGRSNRNFGPDAAPRRHRKHAGRDQKAERAPKRPLRERSTGQFFRGDVDDAYDDDLSDDVFSRGVDDAEREDNA